MLSETHQIQAGFQKKKRPSGRSPKRWSDCIREQCGEPLLNIETQSKRRYAFSNYVFMWDANPTHLSQVNKLIKL